MLYASSSGAFGFPRHSDWVIAYRPRCAGVLVSADCILSYTADFPVINVRLPTSDV